MHGDVGASARDADRDTDTHHERLIGVDNHSEFGHLTCTVEGPIRRITTARAKGAVTILDVRNLVVIAICVSLFGCIQRAGHAGHV